MLIIKMQRSFMNVCFCGLPNHLVLSWTCEWYILYSLISLRFFCSCVQCLDQTRINMHIIPIYHTYFTKSVVSFNWCAKAPELLRDRISFCSSFKVPRSRSRRRFDEACHAENGGCFNRDWGWSFFMVGGKQVKHVVFSCKQDVSINVARFRYW